MERERAEAAAANAGSNLKIEVSVHPWWVNGKEWSVGISVTDGKTISTSTSLEKSREEAYRKAARTTAMKILDMGKVIP